jgi:hypothetical protein
MLPTNPETNDDGTAYRGYDVNLASPRQDGSCGVVGTDAARTCNEFLGITIALNLDV